MEKDERYDDIKPMLKRNKIRTFRDIFKYVPKSVVAIDLGKEKRRFSQLIDLPGGFKVKNIIRLVELCNITIIEMAILIEAGYPKDKKELNKQKDDRYDVIRSRFDDGKITLLENIFDRIPKSKVAEDIKRKPDRFAYLVDHDVQNFYVKDIIAIGRLCDLTIPEMFQLVEAQYAKQNKNLSCPEYQP
jgi:hypothetical protein